MNCDEVVRVLPIISSKNCQQIKLDDHAKPNQERQSAPRRSEKCDSDRLIEQCGTDKAII